MEQERRRSNDELLGKLTEFMEASKDFRKTTLEQTEKLHDKLEEKFAAMDKRFASIESELSIYKTVYKTLKFIGLALAAVATFKFGDVSTIWKRVFS